MIMMERVASALEERPAHHMTRSVKVDAFDPDKHEASTWFNQFASACQAPNKHLWCCLTQNIRDSAALTWAAQQQPAVKVNLKEICKVFLTEFSRTH